MAHYTGEQLVGMHYQQLMPWVKPCEKLDEWSLGFVKDYAAQHPEKVFTGENGHDHFVSICFYCASKLRKIYNFAASGDVLVLTASDIGR